MSLIALEEHYAWDPASADNVVGTWLRSNNAVAYQRLYDRGPLRLEQMDAAGIDFQILSLFDPGVQDETDVARAIELARRANDDLAETVRGIPTDSAVSRPWRRRTPTPRPPNWSVPLPNLALSMD